MSGQCRQHLLPGCLLLAAAVLTPSVGAVEHHATPSICIIIDDIGYRLHEDLRAISIPGSLAYAIMPHAPFAQKMSRLASQNGKLVLLHLPMEAVRPDKNRLLGPGALWLDMSREQFMRTLDIDLRSVPEAVGVNNHEGSLLTRHPGHMEWLMEGLKQNQKFFIDSVTSEQSVASQIALENSVPYLRRDVFLDNILNESYIKAQLLELVHVAKANGQAIGIGHPHPETIEVLARELLELDKYGVIMVNLTELLSTSHSAIAQPVRLSN